jgi:hypothetical protein
VPRAKKRFQGSAPRTSPDAGKPYAGQVRERSLSATVIGRSAGAAVTAAVRVSAAHNMEASPDVWFGSRRPLAGTGPARGEAVDRVFARAARLIPSSPRTCALGEGTEWCPGEDSNLHGSHR